MKKNNLYWLKIHRMADDGGDEGGDDSLLPVGGAPADPPADPGDPGDPPADPPADENDWFKKDKYKTVEDQAKAYNDLEKKLGEKNELVGAPDEGKYEITMPEGIDGKFVDGDPLMDKFKETAAEMNLSQGAFDKILHSYLSAEYEKVGVNREQEIKNMGDNADRRLDSLGKWGGANLDAETYQVFRSVASTAAGVQMLEAMIGNSKDHSLNNNNLDHVNSTGLTAEGVRAMAAEKDEHGHLKSSVDPAHKKKVDQAYRDLYGDEPQKTVVGA